MGKRPTAAKSNHVDEGFSFYEKLFRALEFKKKKEDPLLGLLFERFGFPADVPDPARWFADNRQPEEVMGWLMSEAEPFAKLLEELYQWLADLQATIGGNIREVRFDFARLNATVPFSLESFPKEYVRRWGDVTAIMERFDPRARFRRTQTSPGLLSRARTFTRERPAAGLSREGARPS